MKASIKRIICVTVGAILLIGLYPIQDFKASVIPIPKEFSKHGLIFRVDEKLKGNHGIVSVIGLDDEAYEEDLNNIVIPDYVRKNQITWDVKKIAPFAFNDRTDLNSVVISEGVKEIGYCAFRNCQGLCDLTIPASLNSIETFAFSGCSNLKNINISEDSESFSSKKGLILSKDGTGLLFAPGASGEYRIEKGITCICAGAFDSNPELTGIKLSGSVKTIEEAAFFNCKKMTGIDLKNTEYIGKEAFCNSGLVSVRIPASVTHIEGNPFSYCESLGEITVSKKNTEFRSDNGILLSASGKKVISAAAADSDIVIPSKVTTVGAYAFAGNSKIQDIVFPSGLKKINEGAFADCTSLKKIRFSSRKVGFKEPSEDKTGAFYNTFYYLNVEFPYSDESFSEGSVELTIKANCPKGVLITNY